MSSTSHLELVSWLFHVQILTLPIVFWLTVMCAILLWAFIRLTVTEQGLMAIGFNERASILSGLPVRRLKITAFGLSGFLAGLAGLSVIAISGAASSYGLGSDLLVPGIAAAGTWLLERGYTPRYKHLGIAKPGEGGGLEQVGFHGLEPEHLVAAVKELVR